jgi:hypothetical protein
MGGPTLLLHHPSTNIPALPLPTALLPLRSAHKPFTILEKIPFRLLLFFPSNIFKKINLNEDDKPFTGLAVISFSVRWRPDCSGC